MVQNLRQFATNTENIIYRNRKTNDEMRKITNDGNAIATGCISDSAPRVDMK
jgi:hypothetical protein